MQEVNFLFAIAVLIMSVVVHEVSHGYAANILGDPTAKLAGRLTLNPVRHLDLVGSFLVPALTYFFGGFIFGWAKPVPYNPYNLRAGKWGPAIVASAGPLANLLIALFFGFVLRVVPLAGFTSPQFVEITSLIIFLNIILAVFNFIPVPPLDGSKILFALLPPHRGEIEAFLTRFQLLILLFIVLFLWQFILPLIFFLFTLIAGSPAL
jgi:Zn-dependent protease